MGGWVGRVLLGLRQWSWYGICNGEHGSCPQIIVMRGAQSNIQTNKQQTPTETFPPQPPRLQRQPSPLLTTGQPLALASSATHATPPTPHIHSCRGVARPRKVRALGFTPLKKQPERTAASPPHNPGIKPPELQLGNATLIRHCLPESLAYTENTIGFFVSLNLRAGQTDPVLFVKVSRRWDGRWG